MESILVVFICVVVNISYTYILEDPSYSPDYIYSSSERKTNLRRAFLDKRRQNSVTAKRVKIIDEYLSNNSVFFDGIMHEKVDENYNDLARVDEFETAFRDLLRMKGVKFIYKRDHYWRTWRKVRYPDGDRIVCYRCERSVNSTDCNLGGYWVIDEHHPCPFEIVSVISNAEVCAINITNNTSVDKPCPSVIAFNDILSACDNPIDTRWRLEKVYKTEVSERFPAVLCGGREYCEISTQYLITPKQVSFRIINSTNHIIYSKVMKNNITNYACVTDCGTIDPNTKIVSKTDKPLVIDLINGKNKREDNTKGWTVLDKTTPRTKQAENKNKTNRDKLNQAVNVMEIVFKLPVRKNRRNNGGDDDEVDDENSTNKQLNDDDTSHHQNHEKQTNNDDIGHSHHHHDEKPQNDDDRHSHHHNHHDIKHPTCSSMKHQTEDDASEEILVDLM